MKKLILINIIFYLSSCSINKIAVKKTSQMIENGSISIYSEMDMDYLKNSLPANIKLMEILYANEKDPLLLKNITMGLCGYAFAFYDEEKTKSNSFYLKAIGYSDDYINAKKLKEKKKLSDTEFEILFANLLCKSMYLDTNRDDVNAFSYLGDIEEVAKKLYDISPDYFYNILSTILASIYSTKPQFAGGNLEKAKDLFEKSIKGKGEKFLLNRFFYARDYAMPVLDEELFDRLVDEIINAKIEENQIAFFNEVAKIKAKKLKEKKNEIF